MRCNLYREKRQDSQGQRDELISEYVRYAAIYMKRGGDIKVPALVHTLKEKDLEEIYRISSNLVEEHLRPLLCRLLEIPLEKDCLRLRSSLCCL